MVSDLVRSRATLEAEIWTLLQKRSAADCSPNARLGLAGLTHDLVRADTIGGQQHDFGPPNVLLRRVAVFNEDLEPTSLDFPARIAQTRTSLQKRESLTGLECMIH
jgi:hypothetical protein